MRAKKWLKWGLKLAPLLLLAEPIENANKGDFLRGLCAMWLVGGLYLGIGFGFIDMFVRAYLDRVKKLRERKSIAYKKSMGLYMAKSKKREV